jgi:phage terminase large subunit
MSAAAPATRTVKIELPQKAGFLLEMHRYKVLYGGRGSAKSHSVARALLALGAAQRLRILCAREFQKSIENSVHALLKDCIEAMGLQGFYTVLETEIVAGNGTRFIFSGLAQHTVDSIKSFEGIDIVWVEEGQTVSERSWKILIPTIRAPNSEIWVTFNPDMESDATYQRFVKNKPPRSVVAKMNFYDNPWFPRELEEERAYCERTQPDDYNNIWLGECRQVVVGAIYAKEMGAMSLEGRLRAVPYDPRFPVHTFWDLGWNDKMTVIMAQKPIPTVANVVNYYEDDHRRYDEVIEELNRLGYRWGDDWLPHDGENKNPQTGKSAKQVLMGLGRKRVRIIGRANVEDGIRQARMMFPRVYIDDSTRKTFNGTGYLGGARLIECLRRYRRNVPRTTNEPASPVHDEFSHGCDAWRGMAMVIDRVRNDFEDRAVPRLAPFQNTDAGMGLLG